MPDRYIAIPSSSDDDDEADTGAPTSIEVTDADPRPQWIGLLDAWGVRLYRVRETVPVGFQSSRGSRG